MPHTKKWDTGSHSTYIFSITFYIQFFAYSHIIFCKNIPNYNIALSIFLLIRTLILNILLNYHCIFNCFLIRTLYFEISTRYKQINKNMLLFLAFNSIAQKSKGKKKILQIFQIRELTQEGELDLLNLVRVRFRFVISPSC